MEKPRLPISEKNLTRLLVALCVSLALAGGYFHAQLKTQQRRYNTLNAKYSKLLDDYAALLEQPGVTPTSVPSGGQAVPNP